ncbi:hypothetical protein GLAREA_12347 [Glarea lozoyensis ATCC 20868]|uniref:Peptide N-acetyl-beta-D-glucosaminyl asparaginase amidase A N-terminal domain-containing protein n=1 Tax=Glarea lozoyensis (strain ATCC 20868 / MF5171) TaxID=1116229 RepID=S3DHS5_GLAL2|nr:uncharacterized protein GLAREA_12347 [Glarea lozoyensis ATCC 20868]EPE31591.1 hypothetical protein GLAREA_12347 [Glarea lozoyensis ATCC 20868]
MQVLKSLKRVLVLATVFSEVVYASALEVIQAQVPPRKSFDGASCKQTIVKHVFANSYGAPYVGFYNPPINCSFTTTIFNLSVTSSGRQYDRLALLFLGDVEVWRTSTAMPGGYEIFYSYQKDMTVFDTLLRKEQKLIFDLSNVFSELYTGAFNVTLEALYYNDMYKSALSPPSSIFPISTKASSQNTSSVMSLPDGNGTVSIKLPRNIKTATVSILASGNGQEEFWFTNVPSEYLYTFPENPGWLFGYSPFREVQLLIDGKLAGVSWPFPLLFTGGVDPGLWRPIAGIDSYDLQPFDIDISPWLPLLCDGQAHNFQIKVVGFDSSINGSIGTVGSNWWVTGAVYVWLDEHSNVTTGSKILSKIGHTSFNYRPFVSTVEANNATKNSSFYFSLAAHRQLTISSTIRTSSGLRNATWSQNLSFSNIQNMTDLAFNQSLAMVTTGTNYDSISGIQTTYKYPLNLYSSYIIAETKATLSSVLALVDRSLITTGVNILLYLTGTRTGPESLRTRQSAISQYSWNATIVEGMLTDTSSLEQWFSYAGHSGLKAGGVEQFGRYLKESDDFTTEDNECWSVIEVPGTIPLPPVDGMPHV